MALCRHFSSFNLASEPTDLGFLVCPTCGCVLTVSVHQESNKNRFECRACPFEHTITKPFFQRRQFSRKEKEDVFGGKEQFKNAQKDKVDCPKDSCEGKEAAFYQVQIRSADEPMTTFYKVRSLACVWSRVN